MAANAERTVACLGPAGSYSELAARRLADGARIVLLPSFPAVFDALEVEVLHHMHLVIVDFLNML